MICMSVVSCDAHSPYVCMVSIAHFTLESMTWLQFVFIVVHQSTVHPPTFSYISFIHAGDKSHQEACLHLLQFLYITELLCCPTYHLPFGGSLAIHAVIVVTTEVSGVCCDGRYCMYSRWACMHVCACAQYSSLEPVHTHTYKCTIYYTYTVCTYVIVLSMRYCHHYHHWQ